MAFGNLDTHLQTGDDRTVIVETHPSHRLDMTVT
jgi:hypothetical protein